MLALSVTPGDYCLTLPYIDTDFTTKNRVAGGFVFPNCLELSQESSGNIERASGDVMELLGKYLDGS